jgi:hypothetical protein
VEREMWRTILKLTRSLRGVPPRARRSNYDDRLILRLYLWAVFHDRPLCWACRHTSYGRLFRPRRLPSISQFCRRVAERRFLKLLRLVHERLMQAGIVPSLWFVDGKALPVGPHSADPDADSGYGAGRVGRGYRLHALATNDGRIREFRVTAMRNSEGAVSLRMARVIPRGVVVLADGAYDNRHFYRAVQDRGSHLLTQLRGHSHAASRLRAMGHARREALQAWSHHTGLCRQAMARRKQIERIFSSLCSYGGGLAPLPAWVRRITRVRRWVTAKVILYHARLNCRIAA